MRKPKPRANTFFIHLFGQGLADERYERSTALQIHRPGRDQASARRGEQGAQKQTRDSLAESGPRDASVRDELIVCTGLRRVLSPHLPPDTPVSTLRGFQA